MTAVDLDGVRVAVTRPEGASLIAALRAAGADIVHVPLIEIRPPADGGQALGQALGRLARFDWLVVTSINGVRAVADALATAPAVRLAAVGPTTAAALAQAAGRDVDLVPTAPRGAGLVAEFPAAPARVLLAQAERADPTVADGLRAAGHTVEVVSAYTTVSRSPSAAAASALSSADVVVFASGTAAQAWAAAALAGCPAVVAIGPTTAAAATAVGLTPDVVAEAPTPAAVVAAVARARSGPDATTP